MQKYLHILVTDIVQSMERILKLRCSIGIGRETHKLTGLYRSCAESASALSCDQGGERKIFYLQDMYAVEGTPDLCDKALDKIRQEYGNADISLISVSKEIGISPNYLSMLIKKKTGKSFVDFLTTLRMENAERILRETDMKIREVSEQCGYSDQHYFSYCFKKYAGVSPNILRKQMKNS